jgi:hypothetical protein
MNPKYKTGFIGIMIIVLALSLSISAAQEYPSGDKKNNSSGIDHSLYEKVKSFIQDRQKLFDPGRFTSNAAYILGGSRGCSYGADYSPYKDSLIETCMQRIESKYVRPRELMINKLRTEADLSEGERLLDELQTYYPEAAGKMFRNYLDLLGASMDLVNQAYLYALEPETTGVWRQFVNLPEDSMDSVITDYEQESAAEVYQVRLLAVTSGERVQKLGEELIAFLSSYIRATGKLY